MGDPVKIEHASDDQSHEFSSDLWDYTAVTSVLKCPKYYCTEANRFL